MKLIFPFISAEMLADYAAKGIQSAVNNSGKEEAIAKWSSLAYTTSKITSDVTAWLKDGNLSEAETDEMKKQLEPLFEKVLDLI